MNRLYLRLRMLVAALIIISFLLPNAAVFAPIVVFAQSDSPPTPTSEIPELVPTPVSDTNWQESPAILQPLDSSTFNLVPEPTAVWVDPVINAAAAEQVTMPVVDTEADKTGVVVGAATATLAESNASVQIGSLQLRIARAANTPSQPLTVQAEVLPSEQANELSPVGMAFTLAIAGADGVSASTIQQPLELTLDYSQIPMRYGGSFAERLTLYRVSNCAGGIATLTEDEALPTEPCRVWEALSGENDIAAQLLTVELVASAAQAHTPAALDESAHPTNEATTAKQIFLPLISGGNLSNPQEQVGNPADTLPMHEEEFYVLAAAASSQQGNYQATPLANVSDYQVSLTTGAYQTGYSIPIPPAAGDLAPSVDLGYNSGSVDGMTTNKNNQPGWAGIGWSLESGYIERHMKPCNVSQAPGDFCLIGDTYSIVLNGVSSRLVLVSGTTYRLQNDPYWKVEKFTNGATGHPDTQKEYWIATTPDGTKYRFGGEFLPSTEGGTDQNSAWFVPVYSSGNCSGVSSYWVCDKVWRWNLDRVEDTNANVIAYFYDQEINYYNARTFIRSDYIRAGNPNRIEYGRRVGSNTIPPTRVQFMTEERCEGACVWPTNYPDTPGDLTCASGGTCTQNAPTFWSRKRLNYVEPQYYNQGTSAWVSVARYDLDYTFPIPPNDAQGDSSERKLWLNTITQKLGNGTGGLPATTYGNTMLVNRWDHAGGGVSPLYMPRLNAITTQLGGTVSVTYGQSHACQFAGNYIRLPYDCFPAWFVNGSSSGWTLWNKWKVTQQTTSDTFSGNDTQTLTYSYSTPTWHYNDDPALPDINSCTLCPARHWNDFRGSELVTVTDASGAKSEYRFHRGMNGDRDTTSGGSFSANSTLSDASTRTDENWLRGQTVEERRLTSSSVAKSRSVNWFTWTLNAGSGIHGAYFVSPQKNEATLYGTTNKTTRVEYTYDSYGNVTREIAHGDTSTTADDRNTEYTYALNTTAYIVDNVASQKLWTGTTSGSAGTEAARTDFLYDSSTTVGAAPTAGNLTKSRAYYNASAYNETTTAYDTYGRPTSVTDPRGKVTTTAYHSFYGYITSVTNPLSHVTSFVSDPG